MCVGVYVYKCIFFCKSTILSVPIGLVDFTFKSGVSLQVKGLVKSIYLK